jgi:HEAT repeat protein
MTTHPAARLGSLTALLAAAALPACGQSGSVVERLVNAAPGGNVAFHFTARASVCGDGRAWLRADGDIWNGYYSDNMRALPCESGPVRVVLVREGSALLRIQTFAGPLAVEPGVTDLGAVPAGAAAAWLLDVATKSEGRPARDALLPALLADSASVTRSLLAIARDDARPRDVRRSALGWVVRRRGETGAPSLEEVGRAVGDIARDPDEARPVRESAVGALARLESADALKALEALSDQSSDSWLAKQAIEALARSGDPRARPSLRAAASRAELGEEARMTAINGIAGEYATSKDGVFLRDLYGKANSDRVRETILMAVANIGGRENRDWLVSIARDAGQGQRARKRVIEVADRVGISATDLGKLYDAIDDAEVRASIIQELGDNGTTAASDKLLAIAKGDAQVNLRRRAVNMLGHFDDPKVREALKGIVER